jgi:tetratricopeptide (TPR) repeat protein
MPYLEGQCIGYRMLRGANNEILIIQAGKDAIGQIAQGLLDATAKPLAYETPDGELVQFNLRKLIDEVLERPADYLSLREALARDAGLFAKLLTRIAAPLPHALVLFMDQAEELFTFSRSPEEIRDRDHALKMIQRVVDIRADVKLVISLRTEYYGRLLDHLRAGRRSFSEVRNELHRDFTPASLIGAIERPTSTEPLAPGRESPREKYRFQFAEGVAAQIAEGVLSLRTEHQDSVLPLIQVICIQLYNREKAKRDPDGIITRADLEAIRGVEGGLRAFAEDALERSLGLGPADRSAFKSLFTRLYSRQIDGTLTSWLAPRDALEAAWNGSVPFAQVLESARSVRLLREDVLRVEGNELRPFIRLGHDALARIAAAWKAELDEDERLRQERAQVELERTKRREQIRKLLVVASAAAGLAFLFAGVGWYAWNQKMKAQISEKQAHQTLAEACLTADGLLTEVADVDLADVPGMQEVQKKLLKKAEVVYLEYSKNEGDEPELRWVAGRAYGRQGEILQLQGEYERSERCYLMAIEKLTPLTDKYPQEHSYLRDLVQSHLWLGVLYNREDRFLGAEKELNQALAQSEPLAGSRSPEDARILGDIHYQRGVLLAHKNELLGLPPSKESLDAYLLAMHAIQNLQQTSQEQSDQRTAQCRYLNNLGKLQNSSGKPTEAEKSFRDAVKLVPTPPTTPSERWQLARNQHNLGLILVLEPQPESRATPVVGSPSKSTQQARVDEGQKLLKISCEGLSKLSEEFPSVPQYWQELATVYLNLSKVKRGLSQAVNQPEKNAPDELIRARDLRRKLVQHLKEKALPEHHLALADACLEFASYILDPAAQSAIQEAFGQVEALEATYNAGDAVPTYLQAARGLAYCWRAKLPSRPHEEALADARQAILLHAAAHESCPESPLFRKELFEDYRILSIRLRLLGETAAAAEAAEKLPVHVPDRLNSYLTAAELLARCTGETYQARAVKMLMSAAEKGLLRDPSQLDFQGGKGLASLKDRDDFQKLQQALKTPTARRPPRPSPGIAQTFR